MHRIVALTPAGRRGYLEILAQYILRDESIDEWQLWDNCRHDSDRRYINHLKDKYEKIKVVEIAGSNGSNKSINRFYGVANRPDCFYIKLDDDIVWLPDDFGIRMYEKAVAEKNEHLWWSPLVVNNALCSYWLFADGKLKTSFRLTAQASCPASWRSGVFSEKLHRQFIELLKSDPQAESLKIRKAINLRLARFSINCIAFFGEQVAALGEQFCPPDVDDEEWLSATLPLKTDLPGRLVGDIVVSHFSFFTQENHLVKSGLIGDYAALAGLRESRTKLHKRKVGIKKLLRGTLVGAFPGILDIWAKLQKRDVQLMSDR